MTTVDAINAIIKLNGVQTDNISDGYHSFGELYEHRIELFITLCRIITKYDCGTEFVWKSKKHSDGSEFEGWFVLGVGINKGRQISYHLPISKWEECKFITFEFAPEFDGHTSNDVLQRLKNL